MSSWWGLFFFTFETTVAEPAAALLGDVYIQGDFPGHAVLVADVAEDAQGQRIFLLVRSFMLAKDIHVPVNLVRPGSSWYSLFGEGQLVTLGWAFSYRDLRRFAETDCDVQDSSHWR